ncbi:MAG: nucleotidyltransferase family protein [Candidatus Geothermarchaeales archaeon]
MEVRPFNLSEVPSPWKEILEREVEKLKERHDVVAIGIAGSWAQGDTWSGSDVDIEVVLKGEHDFDLSIDEEEGISVDIAYFGENILHYIPYETRPLHDPHGIMARELASRDLNEVRSGMVQEGLSVCGRFLKRAEEAVELDPRSALVFLHLYAWNLSELLTIAAGDDRTMVRRCSRLERAVKRHGREDLLDRCAQLYGFPETLEHSRELLSHLQHGYREVWGFFRNKEVGPPYMVQQPDSELWFHNRIEPLYHFDSRDFVWLVYLEFPDVTWHFFRILSKHERLPPNMFKEAEAFPERPRKWVSRHLQCLELFETNAARGLLGVAKDLIADAEEFANQELYLR